ncbi:hypothetical protein DL765_006475 [Monosporascus sp. GIB2]|nr:hypothetical protein DL765_006475 [Monosporascus sp. GIB2]
MAIFLVTPRKLDGTRDITSGSAAGPGDSKKYLKREAPCGIWSRQPTNTGPRPEIDGVFCGPQKPGTQRPTNGTKLADLNPCPLNACCDIWGQCGVTDEYCTDTRKVGGAPGTAAPNTNSCISNCGTKITNNSEKPRTFSSVAYFEAWNYERDCLHMTPDQIDTSAYTHIHFAFGGITEDFKVNINNDISFQFEIMARTTGIKRILSFGGWSFSTEGDTWSIFRQGVADANRAAFANIVVDFLKLNNLDEYPGKPDIEGPPPGSPEDAKTYLAFLKLVRSKLPSEKTLSIAAQVSFWYLKQFPIKEIADVVDYIVYMTYDLHGQWDAANNHSNPGCGSGNCLRSHANLTETNYALSMITKAGVPAKKIVVGIVSYGRSFKMAQAGCKTEECKFLGDKKTSQAAPGQCTKTGGYIAAAEIRDIIRKGHQGEGDYTINDSYYDQKTDSDILVYNNDEWVAYLSANTKKSRTDYYKSLNFAGISDWALDLWNDGLQPDDDSGGDLDQEDNFVSCDVSRTISSLDDMAKDSSIPIYCRGFYTLTVLLRLLEQAKTNYTKADNGYNALFGFYSKYYHELVPYQIQHCTGWSNGGGLCLKYMSCTWSENSSGQGTTTGCPVPNHQSNVEDVFTMTYQVIDEAGFYNTLEENYGIAKDRVEFGSRDQIVTCHDLPPDSDCSPIARHWRNEPQGKSITFPI